MSSPFSLKDYLIGYKKQDILDLIYYHSINVENNENKEQYIKKEIFKKIAKLLPQDIIINLPEENILKETFNQQNIFYNLNDYIKSINKEEKNKIY